MLQRVENTLHLSCPWSKPCFLWIISHSIVSTENQWCECCRDNVDIDVNVDVDANDVGMTICDCRHAKLNLVCDLVLQSFCDKSQLQPATFKHMCLCTPVGGGQLVSLQQWPMNSILVCHAKCINAEKAQVRKAGQCFDIEQNNTLAISRNCSVLGGKLVLYAKEFCNTIPPYDQLPLQPINTKVRHAASPVRVITFTAKCCILSVT